MLKDIAILTGATVVTEELGMKIENMSLDELGAAKNIVSTQDTTTII